jgi:hypothetical protein
MWRGMEGYGGVSGTISIEPLDYLAQGYPFASNTLMTHTPPLCHAVFGGIASPPPTPITKESLPEFFELYAKAGPYGRATLHQCSLKEHIKW